MRPLTSALALVTLGIFAAAAGPSTESASAPGERDMIEGVVQDEAGRSLFAAQVQLFEGNRLLRSTRTGSDGRFSLESPGRPGGEGWRLRASSLGFAPLERAVSPGETGIVLALTPAPLPIPGFDVQADRDPCGEGDLPAARALWEAAARRHAKGLDTLGIASYTRVRTDTLKVGTDPAPGMEGSEAGQRGSAPLLRLSWSRRLERDGYAFRVRRTDRERSFDSWSYPPLEADLAFHFGEQLFGALNEFQFDRTDNDGWTLLFCGRAPRRPHLMGTLEIGPDTLIRKAEWRFRTPAPDEGAGGWVRFAPPGDGDDRRFLLPIESVTWRTALDGHVVRRAQWYDGWTLAPGDSVPFLPGRTPLEVDSSRFRR